VGVLGFAQPPRTHESYLPPAQPAQPQQKQQPRQPKQAAAQPTKKAQAKPPSKMLVATSLPEQVTQVLTRALTNLLPGDKTWAAQKCTTWDPDTGTVETTPLTPKAKPAATKTEPKKAAPLHPGFPQTGQFPTKDEYRTATEEAAVRNAANGQLHNASGTPRLTKSGPNRTRMQPSSLPPPKGVSSNSLSRRLPDDRPCRQTTSSD
jgi:hypothetical protein